MGFDDLVRSMLAHEGSWSACVACVSQQPHIMLMLRYQYEHDPVFAAALGVVAKRIATLSEPVGTTHDTLATLVSSVFQQLASHESDTSGDLGDSVRAAKEFVRVSDTVLPHIVALAQLKPQYEHALRAALSRTAAEFTRRGLLVVVPPRL
jgi:hypothetical protein